MAHESSNDLNTPMILVIGLVCSVATFVIILGLTGMFHVVREKQEDRQLTVEYADPDTVIASQNAALREPSWIDPAAGQVRLPIDVAMSKVVNTLRKDPASNPIAESPFASSAAAVSDEAAVQAGIEQEKSTKAAADSDDAEAGDGDDAEIEDAENDKSDAPQGQAIEEKRTNEPLEKAAEIAE